MIIAKMALLVASLEMPLVVLTQTCLVILVYLGDYICHAFALFLGWTFVTPWSLVLRDLPNVAAAA